jgi:thiol-disulfide isomerase/thioredoxin
MIKNSIICLFILTPLSTMAQSAYDSLKKVYHPQYVFEQREKGNSNQYVKNELAKIADPELRQLAACAMASNIHGYGWIDNKKLVSMVDEIIASPASETALHTATRVREELTRSLLNTKIQPISLPNIQGDSLTLTNYYTSTFEYVVVDLWATWCGPCIAEMKKFNDLRKQYNVEFYSISLDDNLEKVKKFVNRNKDYTWPIVWAGKGSPLGDYFQARLIPAFVIVDKNGIIVSHIVGKGLEHELKKLYTH